LRLGQPLFGEGCRQHLGEIDFQIGCDSHLRFQSTSTR
jgi:hypothetical protein